MLRGADVDARIDAFPELELRAGGVPGPYDGPYDPRELMVLRRTEYTWICLLYTSPSPRDRS